jgi:hypothetical protein
MKIADSTHQNDVSGRSDCRACARVDVVEQNLSRRIDALRDSVAASTLSMEKRITKLILLWATTVFFIVYAALFAAMAIGFHWL